ncbi:MAG: disulfide formation protein [Chlamydiales bacterium]|nr:disulfide formation protein [Chlamydiales bacterium]
MAKSIELYLAWLFACLGTLVSLYFSEVLKLEPCHLCWYQRIALFPLVFVLGIAAYRSFLDVARYVLPQVIGGFLFAAYQIAIQEIPGWNPIDMCGAGPSCSEKYDIGLGFITIPMLAAGGFLIIGILLLMSWKRHTRRERKKKVKE